MVVIKTTVKERGDGMDERAEVTGGKYQNDLSICYSDKNNLPFMLYIVESMVVTHALLMMMVMSPLPMISVSGARLLCVGCCYPLQIWIG